MFLRKLASGITAVALVSSISTIPALALGTQVAPASVTGTWAGTLTFMKDGQVVDDDPVHMVLKQEGSVISGTAGPSAERQFPVAKGKVAATKEGTAFTFEVTAGTLVIAFDLKLAEGRLKGAAVGTKDGTTQTAVAELQPVK